MMKAVVAFRDGTHWTAWMSGDDAAAALTRAVRSAEAEWGEDHAGAWLYVNLNPLDPLEA